MEKVSILSQAYGNLFAMTGSERFSHFNNVILLYYTREMWVSKHYLWGASVWPPCLSLVYCETIICCNYFYIRIKWPLTCIWIGIKAHLLEDKQISSVRVFDESKNVTFLRVRLSLNSYILWLDFTQSRFFSHFRYFVGENLKRCNFGRFWSEKGRKTTKTQKTLKVPSGDAVETKRLTP